MGGVEIAAEVGGQAEVEQGGSDEDRGWIVAEAPGQDAGSQERPDSRLGGADAASARITSRICP
jgi:hypothetical protein